MAVLAATFTTAIVFFPVTFFTGVSKYIFTPLALGVVLSIFASYFFAMTVVPLFCAKFIRPQRRGATTTSECASVGFFARFDRASTKISRPCSTGTKRLAMRAMQRPGVHHRRHLAGMAVLLAVTLPFLGRAYFPRTDPGQFIINVRMPSGTRLEVSNEYIAKVEDSHSQRGQAERPGHDRLQHRRLSRSLRHLHHQRLDGYGLCADQPEGRPQHRQL